MPVMEMTVTLDDVTCLLHIPIVGKMMRHGEHISQEYNVELMTWLLSVVEGRAIEESTVIPSMDEVHAPPHRAANEEVIVEEDNFRDLPDTIGIIWTLFDLMDEVLRDGDSIEYFRDLIRRMHDEMCPTATYQIHKD